MSVSTVDKYAYLVERLYEMTLSSELNWKETDYIGRFTTKIGKRNIELDTENPRGAGDPDVYIYIKDDFGKTLESFSDVDLADSVPRVRGYNNYYSLMFDLLKRVARKASGAEEVLDSVLEDLGADHRHIPERQLKAKDDEIPF
jgi:hypothetical protein